jgi:hypothetical protein
MELARYAEAGFPDVFVVATVCDQPVLCGTRLGVSHAYQGSGNSFRASGETLPRAGGL